MAVAAADRSGYYGGTMAKTPPLTPRYIRAVRVRLRLTQQQAADKIGVARRTWMYWESPKRGQAPSPAAARLIRMLDEGKL